MIVVQDTVSLQGPCRSYTGGILAALEIHLLLVTEFLYSVTGVSGEDWGEVLRYYSPAV
jgi:hypothetical protein